MIIESIVTSLNTAGELNIAAMGATLREPARADEHVNPESTIFPDFFELRPFQSSVTFRNLSEHGQGVLHIVDDCRLIVRAALGNELNEIAMSPAAEVEGHLLADCCRCHEFRVQYCDATEARAVMTCRTVKHHRFRDPTGLCRGKLATIEAAILATRAGWIPESEIADQVHRLRTVVDKTGSASDREAFAIVESHLHRMGLKTVPEHTSS